MAEKTHHAMIRLRSAKDGAWFVDPDLRPRLVADATEQETNLTEVVNKILCDRFNVKFAPTGRTREQQPADVDVLSIRLSLPLYGKLAATYGAKYVEGIRRALCDHYGLQVPARAPRTRARRGSRTSAAAA